MDKMTIHTVADMLNLKTPNEIEERTRAVQQQLQERGLVVAYLAPLTTTRPVTHHTLIVCGACQHDTMHLTREPVHLKIKPDQSAEPTDRADQHTLTARRVQSILKITSPIPHAIFAVIYESRPLHSWGAVLSLTQLQRGVIGVSQETSSTCTRCKHKTPINAPDVSHQGITVTTSQCQKCGVKTWTI